MQGAPSRGWPEHLEPEQSPEGSGMWPGSHGSLKMAQALSGRLRVPSCRALGHSHCSSSQWRAVGEGLRPAPGCGAGWGSQLLPGLGEVRRVAETLRDKPPQGPQGPART